MESGLLSRDIIPVPGLKKVNLNLGCFVSSKTGRNSFLLLQQEEKEKEKKRASRTLFDVSGLLVCGLCCT